jgi:hypothetical protein
MSLDTQNGLIFQEKKMDLVIIIAEDNGILQMIRILDLVSFMNLTNK